MAATSRLSTVVFDAAAGRPPPADGAVEVVPAPDTVAGAVLAFTAHHVVAAPVEEHEVHARLPVDDLGAPMSPMFLLWLAGWLGSSPGVHDIVLVRTTPAPRIDLVERRDLVDHPRVRRAARYRTGITVWTPPGRDSVLVIGRGLAGRWEMAYEVVEAERGRGLGRQLAGAASALVPDGEPVFAQVSPGNVASLRATLAAGYTPIGSEVLFPHP